MQIIVKLGKSGRSEEVLISVPSPDWSIAELLAEVRRELPSVHKKLLNHSERYGSELFLALHPDGPERLSESKRLRDYCLADTCTMWLMCAPLAE
jgi:hypothetical protein